jgi:hypothetical protein
MNKWKGGKNYTSVTSSQKWNHVNEKLTLRMRRAHEWMAMNFFDDFRLLMFLNVWSRHWEPHLIGSLFIQPKNCSIVDHLGSPPDIWWCLCWSPGFTPRCLVVSVLIIFLVFCCIFILFVFVLCLVPNVACVSRLSILDYPFGFL